MKASSKQVLGRQGETDDIIAVEVFSTLLVWFSTLISFFFFSWVDVVVAKDQYEGEEASSEDVKFGLRPMCR